MKIQPISSYFEISRPRGLPIQTCEIGVGDSKWFAGVGRNLKKSHTPFLTLEKHIGD